MADEVQRRAGRPRKSEGPRLPYDEVDRLLVEGEEVVGSDGTPTRRFPSFRELGQRFGVAHSLISLYARQHDCLGRRQRFLAGERVERVATAPPMPPAPQAAAVPPARGRSVEVKLEQPRVGTEVPKSRTVPAPPPEQHKAPRRPRGRPRKAEAPRLPYEEIDKLLVFGEVTTLPNGSTTTSYPSHRELARRYGVSVNVISNYAQRHNCKRRREEAQARIAAQADQKLIELRATAIAVSKDETVRMIDGYLREFNRALTEGRVRFDDPTDFNTMVRLKEFILGGADSRRELHTAISLESLQARHARMLREMREATAAEEGLVDVHAEHHAPTVEEVNAQPAQRRAISWGRSISGDEKPPPPLLAGAVGKMITPASELPPDEQEETQ
jgi:hypothetical protein